MSFFLYNRAMEYDVLEGLNPQQIQAVTTTEGYVRVIAGAGSGKTRALTHRFAYLVNEIGISPGNILCVTFTNKAASEMRKRIHEMTGDTDTGYICTFHSFCVSILQEDSHAVCFPKSFMVLDNGDIDAMLRMIYEERNLSMKDKTFANARDMFEMRKGVTEPRYYMHLIQDSIQQLYEKYMAAEKIDDILFYGYLYQQKKCFGLDYNDLIFMSLYIFRTFPDIQLKWQKRLQYIMIDEFQDIDPPQYELMEALCGYHNNLFIVGDPDQTIYTWRGARIGYLLNFDKRFDNVKTISLLTNYRSTPEILNCANSLIDKNSIRMKKDLIPVLPSGTKPVFFHASSPKKEAEWVVEQIGKLARCNVAWRDITILFRAHYLTCSVEEELIRKKIPYRLCSGAQFFDRKEIKDALCYLRMIVQQDDLSFVRIVNVPKRNIGVRRMKILKEYSQEHGTSLYQSLKECLDLEVFTSTKAKEFVNLIEDFSMRMEEKSVSKTLSDILDASGYEKMLRTEGAQERLDDLAELKQSIYEWETTVGEETDMNAYLRHIALFTNAEMSDKEDRVRLMTIHAAKGLEFPYVFICGMSEGIFPSSKVRTMSGMEEERRLAFVAMTRCEKGLYLSDGDQRNASDSLFISRFILDVYPSLVDYVSGVDEEVLQKNREYIAREADRLLPDEEDIGLQAGDRVRHRVFGEGTVEKIDPKEEAIYIRFDSLPTVRALALSAAKKLEKILRS